MKNFENCYEVQVGNLTMGGWAANLREELHEIGVGYISQDRQEAVEGQQIKLIKLDVLIRKDRRV
jgi:hypothetical protein